MQYVYVYCVYSGTSVSLFQKLFSTRLYVAGTTDSVLIREVSLIRRSLWIGSTVIVCVKISGGRERVRGRERERERERELVDQRLHKHPSKCHIKLGGGTIKRNVNHCHIPNINHTEMASSCTSRSVCSMGTNGSACSQASMSFLQCTVNVEPH